MIIGVVVVGGSGFGGRSRRIIKSRGYAITILETLTSEPLSILDSSNGATAQPHATVRWRPLSPADDAALAFATFLRRIALQYDAGAGEWGDAEEITISGDDMQRWVLKLVLNHAVTGHFEVQQRGDVTFPPEPIDLLLDRAAWPSAWGLTVPGDLSNRDVRCCPFQPKDVVNSHWWGVAPFVHKDETWMGGTGAR